MPEEHLVIKAELMDVAAIQRFLRESLMRSLKR